jgi:hypothetical protein
MGWHRNRAGSAESKSAVPKGQEEAMVMRLVGAVGIALVLALPSSAWAGSSNILSDGNSTTENSSASAVATNGGTSTAISESYNTTVQAVATQTLSATVADTTVEIVGNGLIHAGDAYAGTGSGSVDGIAQAAANSGVAGIVQQGLVMSAGGAVKF